MKVYLVIEQKQINGVWADDVVCVCDSIGKAKNESDKKPYRHFVEYSVI